MTDADATFALKKVRDIKEVAWSELCDNFMTLEDMKSRAVDGHNRNNLTPGEYSRGMATLFLLGTIAESLLCNRSNQ